MPTDTEVVKGLAVGEISSALGSNANAAAEIAKQRTRVFVIKKAAADSMASDATTETLGFSVPYAGRVKAIYVTTDADVTGHASNHATITINKRDAAGANSATLGTYTTDSDVAGQGSLAEFVRKAFDLTEANVAVVAGGCVNLAIAKGGSGVVVPIAEIQVWIEDA